VSIDAVEVDPAMVRVAKDQFGLQESDRYTVTVKDGVDFVRKGRGGTKYDLVFVDVDNKDSSVPMSRPSKIFVEPETVKAIKRTCLTNEGTLVIALSCWDSDLRNKIVYNLKEEFSSVINYALPSDGEGVIFCTNQSSEDLLKGFQAANLTAKDDLIDMEDAMKKIEIL